MLTDDQTSRPSPALRRGGSTDVTDHRNEIFFAAVSTTRMPMVVTDPHQPDNPIVFVNPAFLAMTGYAEEEILGRNCRFLQGAETDPATIKDVRDAIAERREIATEILNYRKNGSTFWNALFVSPVYNEDGQLVYFFASQLDVSRRRDAEDALRQSQKMEALGQLTGGIAHDFNNLLQVMTGYLDLLQVGLQNGNMPAGRMLKSVDNTRSAVQKAATLTQQLLAFARKQRLEGRTINLNALCDGMIELARRTLGEHIRLETSYASDLPNCRIDPTQLEVALLNVLLNARDAIGHREDGTVAVRTSHLLVDAQNTVGYADLEPGSYVAIAVSDNGGGIAPDVIERVMDPFFTTKDIGKGTGLGLSMVYGFAKQSGGAVNLYSEQDVGTTIRLYFPAVDDEAKLVSLAPRTVEQPGSGTILVVDDREEVAHVAQAMLEAIGYATVSAGNAKEAIALLRTDRRIDMLFSDLIMPGGINGVMLAREARRIRPAIKILLTTGYADSSLERTDAGGSEFDIIHKPYRQTELLRRVRIVLDGPTGVG